MPALEETYKAKREGKGLVSEIQYNFKQYQRVVEVNIRINIPNACNAMYSALVFVI